MAEIYFYHLEHQQLSVILPDLLRSNLERGIRIAVQTSVPENLERLSASLWAEDISFLAHGYGEDNAVGQTIWLGADAANPNSATYRFFVQGTLPLDLEHLQRALIIVDANSEEALINARSEWKKRKSEGHALSYWKQDDDRLWANFT